MHSTFFILPLFIHLVASHPGLYEARQEASCTDVQTVTATTTVTSISIPPAITITTSVSIIITTTVTAPTTQTTISTTTSIPALPSTTTSIPPLSSITCVPALVTLPDGGFEERVPWTGQPPTSVQSAWVYDNQHSGLRAVQLSVGGRSAAGQYELWHGVTACPGTTYKFSAWAKTPDVSSGCMINWVMDDTTLLRQNFTTTGYELATATWVAPVPLDELLILKVTVSCNATAPGLKRVYLDDVSLDRVR